MPAVSRSNPPPPELYGVLGDEDAYKSLRSRPDSEYLSRYPSFHPSSPAFPGGAHLAPPDQPAPLKPSTPPDVTKPGRVRSRQPDEAVNNAYLTPAIQVSEAPSQPTGTSWYDPDAEVWKPKKSTSNARRPPPSRPAPALPPVEIVNTRNDPAQPLNGILIKEPTEHFSRAKGPRRSAMKGPPASLETPSPLPPTAFLSPEGAAHRRLALKHGVPANSTSPPLTAPLNAPSPYWMSPATTLGRLSSAATSHRGSSTGTSSVAFTSTSYYSSSVPSSRGAKEAPIYDGEPIENPVPRATLFVVNADPEPSESEPSPIMETKPFRPGMPPVATKPTRKKLHKANDSRPQVPPVPPLPPQFKAPPPPSYPPPENQHHARTRSEPTVPFSKSGSDRERPMKRHASDNAAAPPHASSKPIPIPRSSGHGSPSDAESSSSSEAAPFTPQQTPPSATGEDTLPAEWIYPLQLTLEELFKGGKYTFRITTRMLDGTPKISDVAIDVKPGWKSGTRIIFPAAGNERKPGVYQDMIFVVEQVHHERFARLDGGRLVLNQDIDLVDALKDNVKRPSREIVGLDGQTISFHPPTGVIKPGMETSIKGHGMWIRSKSKTVGRGDLIIKWNVSFPSHMSPEQLNQMRAIFSR